MSETKQELAKPGKDLRSLMSSDHFKEQIQMALPSHMSADRFARIALTALTRAPKLLECSRESVLKCCMDLSSFGLEPDGRHAHIIPYGKEATLVLDYKGLIALAKRGGEVKTWSAELVKENDEFTWDNGIVNHKVNWRADRGKTQCVYSRVTMADGTCDFEVMTLAEVEAIRKRSKAGQSGPWVTDFDEMARKTVIRRHSKRLTLSPEFIAALAADGDKIEERPIRNVSAARVPSVVPPPPKILEAPPDDLPLDDDRLTAAQVIRQKMEASGMAWSDIRNWSERNGEPLPESPEKADDASLRILLENWDSISL